MRQEAATKVAVDSINVNEGESTLGSTAQYELLENGPDGPAASKAYERYAAGSSVSHRGEYHDDVVDWQRVDRALRTLARRRATLDADEARWLREAEECQLWRHLGMVSAIDYMERVLGYGPRVAQDRLRVARALGALPLLTAALSAGELPFTAVRELTRVATPSTEADWRRAARGKTVGQIEDLVAGRRPGDNPDDPVEPEVRPRVVRFELSPETFTSLRQAQQVLNEEHGRHLSDDELVAALASAVLDTAPATEPTGRAKHQIAVIVCERCGQGWQEGAGAKLAISAAALERATCDAQHIGSLDGSVPERAHQDVPPSVVRLVWRRDGGRCRIPGCRSTRGLEIHHLIHRADGGNHDIKNLILACSSCHIVHHRGFLTITGTADEVVVHRRAEATAMVNGAQASASAHSYANGSASLATGAPVGANANTHADAIPATGAPVDANANADADAPAIPMTGAQVGVSATSGAAGKLDAAILRTQAKEALVGLGWKPAIAAAAVAAAAADLGAGGTLEQWIRAALRRCPRPRT